MSLLYYVFKYPVDTYVNEITRNWQEKGRYEYKLSKLKANSRNFQKHSSSLRDILWSQLLFKCRFTDYSFLHPRISVLQHYLQTNKAEQQQIKGLIPCLWTVLKSPTAALFYHIHLSFQLRELWQTSFEETTALAVNIDLYRQMAVHCLTPLVSDLRSAATLQLLVVVI